MTLASATDMSVTEATEYPDAPSPPRGSARQRGREATRSRLVAAGRRLFAERGLHRVTTHDLAAEAEVAAGTFYLHFTHKRALLREICQESVDDLVGRMERVPPHSDVGAMVAAHAETMVRFAEENRQVMRILFSADGDAAAVESDLLDQLAASIAHGRRERAADREPDGLDPEVLAQAVVGMWSRVLAWWCEDPSRVSRETLKATLERIQLSGTHPARGFDSTAGPGSTGPQRA